MKARNLFACSLAALMIAACGASPTAATAPQEVASETLTRPTSTETSEPPTSTPIPTSTAATALPSTPGKPIAYFLMNANCRSGPDKTKEAVAAFTKDQSAEIVGRNDDITNTWWLVKLPNSDDKCWVSTVTAQVVGSYDDIPTIPPPY